MVAHSILPEWISAGLGIAFYALFIAIVVPGCRRNAKILLIVLATAISCTLLSLVIDGSWAIVISTLVWAALGAFFIKDLGLQDNKDQDKQNSVEKSPSLGQDVE